MISDALDVFISYSRQDEALKDELARHLRTLEREGKISLWQNRNIEAGVERDKEIKARLDKAQIILLLVTSNFLACDTCYETEVQRAIQRHHEGAARVIPILLKPCSWESTNFKSLQALPKNGEPVTRWQDRDEAYFDIEKSIRQVVGSLNSERSRRGPVAVKRSLLECFTVLGYSCKNGDVLNPEGPEAERQRFGDVLLKDRLAQAIERINPHIPSESRASALRKLQTIASSDLIANNETFHRYLTEGITVEYVKNGETKGEQLWLIDWDIPDNNEFLAVEQFTVIEDNHNHCPDIVLFINGLPLVVIELNKAADTYAADANANLQDAFNQLQIYKREIPSLFTYNALLVISDGLSARAGSLSAPYSRFSQWKRKLPNGDIDNDPNAKELEVLTQGMLNKSTLLDLVRHFNVFEKIKTKDPNTDIVTLQTIKKVAAYHQYHAVNKAVESVIAATKANHRGGVVWHTQGSGKSLSMVFLSGKLVLALDNPTLVVLTDRNDLDDQLFDTFAGCRQLLRQAPQQANNREAVRELLNVSSGGIVFTTVQKFAPEDGETLYPQISDRANIVVLADEAHRSQYGFKAKQVNLKDSAGNIIGKQTKKPGSGTAQTPLTR